MLIDSHVHLFPDIIAQKTLEKLSSVAKLVPATDGTYLDTDDKMEKWGVDKFVVLHIATNEKQQKNVNDFAIKINNDRCICFGSVYPRAENALEQLDLIASSGIKGIKLHPDYQQVEIDDNILFPIYERLCYYDLPLVIHSGYDPISPQHTYAPPQKIAQVLVNFPKLKLICAHFGGLDMWDDTEKYLVSKNVWFDTSFSAGKISKEQALRIINNHGLENVLFGSDCPWQSPKDTFEFIDGLNLTSSQKDAIFYKNAISLLKLK